MQLHDRKFGQIDMLYVVYRLLKMPVVSAFVGVDSLSRMLHLSFLGYAHSVRCHCRQGRHRDEGSRPTHSRQPINFALQRRKPKGLLNF